MTTSYNDPFNVARRLASLDLISGGRAGWNVVTSGDAGAAGNFSRDEHYDYDTRYARASSSSALPRACGTPTRQHAFPRDRSHPGPSSTGPGSTRSTTWASTSRSQARSTSPRSPQGQPVIFQAGDSEQGRDLGATIGEGIFTFSPNIGQARRSTPT